MRTGRPGTTRTTDSSPGVGVRFGGPGTFFHTDLKELNMSDKNRWRYFETNPVVAAVDAETVIEIGDLVWQDVDDAKPASVLPDAIPREVSETEIDKAGLQEHFASKFLGCSMQRSRQGDTGHVRVAITGVFEFDCPSGTFELGDLIAASDINDRLLNQRVVKVVGSELAIGRVAKREASAATSVLVDIRSTVMTGGVR